MKFVDDDDAEFFEVLFFQKSIDKAVGLLDGADGHVDGLEAAGWMVAAHEPADAMRSVSEQFLPFRYKSNC